MEYHKLTVKEIRDLIKEKKATAVEVVNDFLKVIKEKDPEIKAYLKVCEEEALKQAQEVDDKIAKGEDAGELAGVPFALKDNYLTKGIETTSASQVLKGYIPQYSAEMYERLRNAGAILLGKTNLDTFAFGASTENSGYFTTHNPHDLERVPGGSSGGSAAAVAADMCAFALGSDTGGSIRQPASLCGIVGLKPTYGRCSRYGMTAMASSFDCPGPLTETVEDAAIVLKVMAGIDGKDSTTSPTPVDDYEKVVGNAHGNSLQGLRIGVPKEYFIDGMEKSTEEAVKNAIKKYEEMGAEIVEISLPHTEYGLAVYYILVPCEVSANMARYDGIRFGQITEQNTENIVEYYMKTRGEFMEPELKRRIMIGSYALSSGYYDAYYKKASEVRTLIREEFEEAFKKVDVIMTPTSPTTAFKIGEKANDPLQMYLADVFTVCVNVAGIPSINIPVGKDEKGLPIGMQVMGNYWEEEKIMKIASLV
jgi:aspartyl-tRNA(Asn)/glutamyl-tRNA(Gln) amidotransferase subunit A